MSEPGTRPARTPDATRDQLVASAERLFAGRGVAAVSLREICRDAGQRNVNAARFHFGDHAGLVTAIRGKHERGVDDRRDALLDLCEASGGGDLRTLVSALVLPVAAKLDDPDGGPAYLAVVDQLLSGPDADIDGLWDRSRERGSSERWRALVAPHLPEGAAALNRRFSAVRLMYSELARRARQYEPGARDHALFVSDLTDRLTALLAAPVSEQTLRIAARTPGRTGRTASEDQ